MTKLSTNRAVFSVRETAEILGISPGGVYEAIRRNEIPSLKIGRRIVVPRVLLDRLLGNIGEVINNAA